MLIEKTVTGFIEELASSSPAPGGGSAAALAGAISSALTSMVCRLTIGKKKYTDVQPLMETTLQESEKFRTKLLRAIDEDTAAFNLVMDAFALPKETDEQKRIRAEAIQTATKGAVLVPLAVMELTTEIASLARSAAESGNSNSITDAGVAALMAEAACKSAMMNVLVNLNTLTDEEYVISVKRRVTEVAMEVEATVRETMGHIQAMI